MPPIRFRIRTIMIVIAVAALLMGLLRLGAYINAGLFDVAIFIILFVELLTFANYFWHGTRPREQYLRRIKHRTRRPEPDRSGEAKGV